MPTTTKSSLAAKQDLGRAPAPVPAGFSGIVRTMWATVAAPVTLAAADILNFFTLPAGAIILDASIFSDQVDSNGAPTFKLDVGGATANDIFAASTVGRTANSLDRGIVRAIVGTQYANPTLVKGTVNTVAATKVAGNITLQVDYALEGKSTS